MKKIIQPFIILALLLVTGLTSCTNYGKKVKIEGTKGEVYYIGKGVTENDARKVGNYLKETGFLSAGKPASIQVSKVGERYLIRFVYDKTYYEKTSGLEDVFKTYGVNMSKELFNGSKVDIALADKYFKDFKSIPYDETFTQKPENPEKEDVSTTDKYDHDKAGDVDFYWKGISDEESKTIADYIVQNGSFAGGTAEIYITKEGDRYILKFPVKVEYQTDAGTINQIEKVSKEIKENVFPNTPYSFQMTDLRLNSLRSFDY